MVKVWLLPASVALAMGEDLACLERRERGSGGGGDDAGGLIERQVGEVGHPQCGLGRRGHGDVAAAGVVGPGGQHFGDHGDEIAARVHAGDLVGAVVGGGAVDGDGGAHLQVVEGVVVGGDPADAAVVPFEAEPRGVGGQVCGQRKFREVGVPRRRIGDPGAVEPGLEGGQIGEPEVDRLGGHAGAREQKAAVRLGVEEPLDGLERPEGGVLDVLDLDQAHGVELVESGELAVEVVDRLAERFDGGVRGIQTDPGDRVVVHVAGEGVAGVFQVDQALGIQCDALVIRGNLLAGDLDLVVLQPALGAQQQLDELVVGGEAGNAGHGSTVPAPGRRTWPGWCSGSGRRRKRPARTRSTGPALRPG